MQKLLLLFLVCFLRLFSVSAFAESNEVDSLKQLITNAEGEEKAKLLLSLAGKVWMTDSKESLLYAQLGLEAAEQANYKKGIIRGLLICAGISNRKGQYALTEELAQRAIDLAKEENYVEGLIRGQLILGGKCFATNEIARAFEYNMEGLAMARQACESDLELSCLSNFGAMKMHLGKGDEAEEIFHQALRIAEETGRPCVAGGTYSNLGLVEHSRNNSGKAIEHYEQALKYYSKCNDEYRTCTVWINLGLEWQTLDEHEKAIRYFDKSIAHSYTNEARPRYVQTIIYKAASLKELNQEKKAIQTALEALAIAEELSQWNMIMEVNELLYQLYDESENLEQAFAYYKSYVAAKDTVEAKENRDKLAELSTKYELDDLKIKNDLQAQEAEIASLKLKQRNLLLAGLIALVVSISLGFFFVQRRTKTMLDATRTDYLNTQKESEGLAKELEEERKKLADFAQRMREKSAAAEPVEESDSNQADSEEIERLLEKLNTGILNDKDWISFNLLFDAAYPDFDRAFRSKVPDSTHNHKRLAALVKTQLSNKEIGAIFNISRDSVVRAKYRLRQKMGFDTNQRMEDYLKSL